MFVPLLLSLSPLGAALLQAQQQLPPLALRRDQLRHQEIVALSPWSEGVSVLIQLNPGEPWQRDSERPGLQLYRPRVAWADELVDPLPLTANWLESLTQAATGTQLTLDHEAAQVLSLESVELVVASVSRELPLNRRDPAHAQALASVAGPGSNRPQAVRRSCGGCDCTTIAPLPPGGLIAGLISLREPCHGCVEGAPAGVDVFTAVGLLAVLAVETVRRVAHA